MKKLKTVVVVFALLLLVSAAAEAVDPAQGRRGMPSQGDMNGTVSLHGANISPSDIKIRLRPMVGQDPEKNPGPPAGGAPSIRMARVSAIPGEPNGLQFTIPDVVFGLPYRLGIQFNNKSVGKVVWRVTNEGMVVLNAPGGTPNLPVRIDGYVVTSELEILGSTAGGNGDLWVGADTLDFNDPGGAVRTLRWKTSLPGVTKGRLQVLTQPPTVPITRRPPNPCDTTGLIHTVDFDVLRNGWTSLPPVDFHSIILGTRSGEVAFPGVDPRTLLELQMGAPVYLRAVPLDSTGAPICNSEQSGLPGMVVVANLALKTLRAEENAEAPIKLHHATYEPPNVQKHHPTTGEYCYQVTKDHYVNPITIQMQLYWNGQWISNPLFDVYNYYVYWSSPPPLAPNVGQTYGKGYFFCIPQNNGNDSWLEDFSESLTNLVTGFLGAFGDMVNYFAKLWEDVKRAVAGAAAGLLQDAGIPCGDSCKGLLEYGLEIGMAAMGVPPRLPNADELMHAGAQYLAEMAAEQAGLGGFNDVADFVGDKAVDYVDRVAQDMKAKQSTPGLPDWLTYSIGLDPAVLTLYLEGPGVELAGNPFLVRNTDPIFLGTAIPLPRTIGTTPNFLSVPVLLQPNFEGLPPLCWIVSAEACAKYYGDYYVAIWNKQHWVNERLNNGCAQFYVKAFAPGTEYRLFSANVAAEHPVFYLVDNFSNCTP